MLKWPVSPSLASQADQPVGRLRPGFDFVLNRCAAGSVFVPPVFIGTLKLEDQFVFAHLGVLSLQCLIDLAKRCPIIFTAAIDFIDAAPQPLHVRAEQPHGVPRLIVRLSCKADKGRSYHKVGR